MKLKLVAYTAIMVVVQGAIMVSWVSPRTGGWVRLASALIPLTLGLALPVLMFLLMPSRKYSVVQLMKVMGSIFITVVIVGAIAAAFAQSTLSGTSQVSGYTGLDLGWSVYVASLMAYMVNTYLLLVVDQR